MTSEPSLPEPGHPAEPGWIPVTLVAVRDRSPVGWSLLQRATAVADLRARHVVCAVHDLVDPAQPDLLIMRVAVTPEGVLAVVGPDGSLTTGPRVEEVVSELAHEWRTTIVVDDQVYVGPDGVPRPDPPTDGFTPAADTRNAYAFPADDLLLARAMALQIKEPLTVYHAQGWVVLASDHAPRMRLTPPGARFGARYPFVAMRRSGGERQLTYLRAKGERALSLDLTWAPALVPEVDTPDGVGDEVRDLAARLAHPRLGVELVVEHPDVSEPLAADLAATLDGDGDRFLARLGELLDLPPLVAALAETRPGDPEPGEVRERIEPAGRAAFVRQAFSDAVEPEEESDSEAGPIDRARRWVHDRPRLMAGLAGAELIGVLVVVVGLLVGGWAGGPWWVTVLLVLLAGGLLLDGGIRAAVAWARRSRRPDRAEDGR